MRLDLRLDRSLPALFTALALVAAPGCDDARPGAGSAEAGVEDLLVFVEGGPTDQLSSRDGVDAVIPAPDCPGLAAQFDTFVRAAENRTCVDKSDCALIDGAGDCSCVPRPLSASGAAIAKSAAPRLKDLITEYYSKKCESFRNASKLCDAGPAMYLRCHQGLCTADESSCLGSPKSPCEKNPSYCVGAACNTDHDCGHLDCVVSTGGGGFCSEPCNPLVDSCSTYAPKAATAGCVDLGEAMCALLCAGGGGCPAGWTCVALSGSAGGEICVPK